ncbi:hypothetical protein [Amycolatopsis sp. FDAARGOS 1241]|uniref:hypothetical protein n=1 Tax=Amycolatopsis sp. FDAARGOS 1241 TaxID=2778070 RepID=UPI0019521285|nr:hypothetical protein [Amycolatopsis sp. FDAARGOS 1241]QRP43412.1 hypothetical protein I6J71_28855 [Amycolatopsis sp. FDAARGOS 1241]
MSRWSGRSRGCAGARRTRTAAGSSWDLALALVHVPCAGPVLATIAVLGATHRIGFGALVPTAAFGAGIPLLVIAVAGDQVTRRGR